jgi:hypothetical protein
MFSHNSISTIGVSTLSPSSYNKVNSCSVIYLSKFIKEKLICHQLPMG